MKQYKAPEMVTKEFLTENVMAVSGREVVGGQEQANSYNGGIFDYRWDEADWD